MDNIREGNVSVYVLKKDVERELKVLKGQVAMLRINSASNTPRIVRQMLDAEAFLNMLNESSYASCKTVDELKQRISRKRNRLKEKLSKLDPLADGHQISLNDVLNELSEEEMYERDRQIEKLNEEIRWLHKCLGICKNKDYFN